MPFTPHWLLSYGGTLGSNGEIWSNGIRMASQADLDDDDLDSGALADYSAAIATLFADSASKIGTHCKVRYVKFNKIGADGRYVSNTESNTRFLEGPAVIAGISNAAPMPYNVSCCVTWLTAFARGRGSRGRIFSPGATFAVDGEGVMPDSSAVGISIAYAKFISDLNGVNPDPGDARVCVVASGINGALNPINRVSVGTVPDTMRSRRNSLVETRMVSQLP